MKMQIALASRSYPDSDLSTLRSLVPNGNFANFDPSDNMHFDAGRKSNNLGQGITKPTISKNKKKQSKKRKAYQKEQDKLKLKLERDRQTKQDAAAPAPTPDRSQSADMCSRFDFDQLVHLVIQGSRVWARVLGMTFRPGKVMYTLAVYTGIKYSPDDPMSDRYGLLNSVGVDDKGREFIRVANVDSVFVESVYPEENEPLLKTSVPEQPGPMTVLRNMVTFEQLNGPVGQQIPAENKGL